MSTLEMVILGALVVLLLFGMNPGFKAALARSKQAPADWQGMVLPLGLVVGFVLFLIMMV